MTDAVALAVAGAKGGVGKTTTSLNLSAALAGAGHAVVVVEVDLAMANLPDFLHVDCDPERDPTLHDVLADRVPVGDALYEAPGEFTVLPSGTTLEGYAEAAPQRLGGVLDELRPSFDVIVLDTAAGLSYETVLPLGLADAVVLVSTPRLASVRDVTKTRQLAERAGTPIEGIVFAFAGTGRAPDVDRISAYLEVDLLGHVPEDPAVMAAQDGGRPVVVDRPDSPAARSYRAIARGLGGLVGDAQEASEERPGMALGAGSIGN